VHDDNPRMACIVARREASNFHRSVMFRGMVLNGVADEIAGAPSSWSGRYRWWSVGAGAAYRV
jgi:hypothetical protein